MEKDKKEESIEIEVVDQSFLEKLQAEVDSIESDIPEDANATIIKEILGRLPSEIEYWNVRLVSARSKVNAMRSKIETKKELLTRAKSRIRQEKMQLHKQEVEEFLRTIKDIFKEVIQSQNKVTKSTLQEMVKAMRPEKPTKADLDDMANLETVSLQEEIFALEEEKNRLEVYHDLLHARVKKYENKLKSAIAHKGILVEELKNNLM